jgi:hypothetical protein
MNRDSERIQNGKIPYGLDISGFIETAGSFKPHLLGSGRKGEGNHEED